MATYTIGLIVGDPSDDGHGKVETVWFECSHRYIDVQKAFEKGSKILGFDITKSICMDYEDNSISKACLDTLVKNGVYANYDGDDEDGYTLYTEVFAELYMDIAKLGDKKISYTSIYPDTIDIGGYGLFT